MRYAQPQWNAKTSALDLRKLLFNTSLAFLGDFDLLSTDELIYQLPLGVPICRFRTKKKVGYPIMCI